MSYQVIARKWRPKSFDELVGQSHVTQTLLNALRSGRLPHALLFSGARGVGKTSSARIFAKSLRCPNSKEWVPCNTCQTCTEIAQGNHIDVIEIDGASNNGVDAIRELRETVGYMPASGKYKVYIIDEVHMLSTSAFNALLKTLEEPPSHVVFIFATTEPQKIPVTILSRCQRFDFRRIPTRQIAERLELICKSENISAETEALWTIARQAEGALRDSQSLLDQAITYCDGKITQAQVTQVLGLTDRALLFDTLNALVERNAKDSMAVIEKLYMGGYDASVYVQDLLEQLRHLLMVKLNPQDAHAIVDLPESEIEALKALSNSLSSEDTHMLFDMALKGANDLIRSQNPRIVLEMLLLRMTSAPRITEISELLGGGAKTTTTVAPLPPRKSESAPPTTSSGYDSSKDPQQNWLNLIQKIKANLPSLGAKLEYLSLLEMTGEHLRLAAKDQLMLSQVNEKSTLTKIQTFIKTYWDKTLEIKVELTKNSEAPLSPKEAAQHQAQAEQENLLREVENHPLVKKTQSTFKTRITGIKE